MQEEDVAGKTVARHLTSPSCSATSQKNRSGEKSLNESGCSHSATYLPDTHPAFPQFLRSCSTRTVFRLQDPPCVLCSLPSVSHLSSQRLTPITNVSTVLAMVSPAAGTAIVRYSVASWLPHRYRCPCLLWLNSTSIMPASKLSVPTKPTASAQGAPVASLRARTCLVFAAPMCVAYTAVARSYSSDSLSFAWGRTLEVGWGLDLRGERYFEGKRI